MQQTLFSHLLLTKNSSNLIEYFHTVWKNKTLPKLLDALAPEVHVHVAPLLGGQVHFHVVLAIGVDVVVALQVLLADTIMSFLQSGYVESTFHLLLGDAITLYFQLGSIYK